MLLRYDENGGFWATPGGSLEPGETHRQAVVRELREELGARHVTLGPHLATRTKDHPVAGRNVRQAERYYLARVQPENLLPQSAASPDNIQEWRWWTLAELAVERRGVFPWFGLSAALTVPMGGAGDAVVSAAAPCRSSRPGRRDLRPGGPGGDVRVGPVPEQGGRGARVARTAV
jgi:8-oxo-dGTP pyrophosphatase MutT (NUDIX family)